MQGKDRIKKLKTSEFLSLLLLLLLKRLLKTFQADNIRISNTFGANRCSNAVGLGYFWKPLTWYAINYNIILCDNNSPS